MRCSGRSTKNPTNSGWRSWISLALNRATKAAIAAGSSWAIASASSNETPGGKAVVRLSLTGVAHRAAL